MSIAARAGLCLQHLAPCRPEESNLERWGIEPRLLMLRDPVAMDEGGIEPLGSRFPGLRYLASFVYLLPLHPGQAREARAYCSHLRLRIPVKDGAHLARKLPTRLGLVN